MSEIHSIHDYLEEMVRQGAADLFLTVDLPPSLRVEHNIMRMDKPPLTEEDMEGFLSAMLTDDQREEFYSTLELNIALALNSGERFRVNIFKQKHSTGMVIRLIKSKIPSFEELRLPGIYKDFIMKKRGLVLVVGATGSGKSTSMAAMLEHRNTVGEGHIVTIEDPVEYYHHHKNCLFTQREIGIDTYSYGIALKNALRQSPDVMVIGEIRDREVMENALVFCETGHLVISTLHSNNSNQTIERIINLFPEELHKQILTTLSQNLVGVVSQRLVEGKNGHHVLAYEIMINEGLIKALVEEGKIKELKDTIEKSRDVGMQTLDQCLLDLYNKGMITKEVALAEADNASNLNLKMKQGGEFFADPTGGVSLKKSSGSSDF